MVLILIQKKMKHKIKIKKILHSRKGSSTLTVRGWIAVRVRLFHVTSKSSTNVEWIKFACCSSLFGGERRTLFRSLRASTRSTRLVLAGFLSKLLRGSYM